MHVALKMASRHWFYVLLPVLLGVSLEFRMTYPWNNEPRMGEATALFDWCLFVPILYLVCYRGMPPRVLALRTIAIVCGGIWIAAKVVPDPAETILAHWGWLRHAGIALLAVFELLAFAAAMRVVFGAAPDLKLLQDQGIPPVIAKLMLAEARFWRWVWTRLRGR